MDSKTYSRSVLLQQTIGTLEKNDLLTADLEKSQEPFDITFADSDGIVRRNSAREIKRLPDDIEAIQKLKRAVNDSLTHCLRAIHGRISEALVEMNEEFTKL